LWASPIAARRLFMVEPINLCQQAQQYKQRLRSVWPATAHIVQARTK
jgi:hypothetical protein